MSFYLFEELVVACTCLCWVRFCWIYRSRAACRIIFQSL